MRRTKTPAGSKAMKRHPFFVVFRALFRLVFPRHRIVCSAPVPSDRPCVFVCNHAGIYAPIVIATWLRRRFRPWVKSDTCFMKTARAQIERDLFKSETRADRVFHKILSALITPVAVAIMRGVGAIPVYGDIRIVTTFRQSVRALMAGASLVIFPENEEPYSEYTKGFSTGFVHVGRKFCAETGERLDFYPVYVSKKTRTVRIGDPIAYLPRLGFNAQRARVAGALRDNITRMARELEEGAANRSA
jgi:hypothetical protein